MSIEYFRKESKPEKETFVFSVRLPIKYKKFIEDYELDNKKIVISTLDELETQVRKNGN